MNVGSQLDPEKARPAEAPDIILGEDWDEQAREQGDEEPRDPATGGNGRGWIGLNRSPLARKIITFNLLALVVLVGGVLYLNQADEGLIRQRERMLTAQTRLMARLIATDMRARGVTSLGAPGYRLRDTLAGFDLPGRSAVLVLDPDERLVASVARAPGVQDTPPPYGTIITDFLNNLWDRVAGLFGDTGGPSAPDPGTLARSVTPHALAGNTIGRTLFDGNGDPLIVVATPIRGPSGVLGALVVTATASDITELARNRREQVLQMFVIAILVSIGLSLVLASTIANPLRDLAQAAELGRNKTSRKVRPRRVRIPDMTARPDEIGRLSGALRAMITALYDRIDANEQFAADVAHEIKNPLSSLRSAVETLRVARNDVQRNKLLDVIEHDVRRLDRLVSDISNASRLDSELVKEEMESFNLVQTLENLVQFHGLEAREKGIEFIADLPDAPIVMRGLEGRLAQVFVNLLTNAISFCQEGDAVRIWARKRADRILVVVEDTGPGIPEEALGKIFNRFYSERPANDFGNHSGLGLAISRQIVEAHGGVIWAENIRPTEEDITSEPLGARFVVGLPA